MKFWGKAFRQGLGAWRGDSALPGTGSVVTGDVLPVWPCSSRKDAVFFL